MKAEAMVQYANDVLLFARRAVSLRQDARNYRALGKEQLAELLDQEADENEESAREVFTRLRGRDCCKG